MQNSSFLIYNFSFINAKFIIFTHRRRGRWDLVAFRRVANEGATRAESNLLGAKPTFYEADYVIIHG